MNERKRKNESKRANMLVMLNIKFWCFSVPRVLHLWLNSEHSTYIYMLTSHHTKAPDCFEFHFVKVFWWKHFAVYYSESRTTIQYLTSEQSHVDNSTVGNDGVSGAKYTLIMRFRDWSFNCFNITTLHGQRDLNPLYGNSLRFTVWEGVFNRAHGNTMNTSITLCAKAYSSILLVGSILTNDFRWISILRYFVIVKWLLLRGEKGRRKKKEKGKQVRSRWVVSSSIHTHLHHICRNSARFKQFRSIE